MKRNIRSRRTDIRQAIPKQASICRFYEYDGNCCGITKNGEMICEYKRCSLCIAENEEVQ